MARFYHLVSIFTLLFLTFMAESSTDAAIFITGVCLLIGLDRGNRHD